MLGTFQRPGGLAVVQHVHDRDWINRLLKTLSPKLFVEQQLTYDEERVWCVVEDTGDAWGETRFVCVYEFRDGNGDPIPYLTEHIVDEMRRRAQSGVSNVQEALRIADERNRVKRERQKADARAAYEEVRDDFHRLRKTSPVIHRSVGLRMARDKMRGRGENV